MSRGFVKEGDQEEVPMVPPRAFLPAGVANYVTPEGLRLLLEERQSLLDERNQIQSDMESDARVMRNFINAKLELLEHRIKTAKLTGNRRKGEIAFGTTITIKMNGTAMTVQITGVDEAAVSKGKIPFTSPLARALFGHHAGDFFDVDLPTGITTINVVSIDE